jgi:hypothetical protein
MRVETANQSADLASDTLAAHDAPVAMGLGLLWASVGCLTGATLLDYLCLSVGGAITQWLLMLVVRHWALHREASLRVLLAGGLALLFCVPTAWRLLSTTHHRPLGAVVFAVAAVLLALAAAGAVRPLVNRISEVPQAVLPGAGLVLLLGVVIVLATQVPASNPLLTEVAVGALLFVVGARVRRHFELRFPPILARSVPWLLASTGALLFALPSFTMGARAAAPLVLGLVGLSH